MLTKSVGSYVCWYAILGELFAGEIIADDGDCWLVRRSFGGVCLVLKSEEVY